MSGTRGRALRAATPLLVPAVALAVALAGCGAIPRDGPVHRYAEATPTAAESSPVPAPAGPRDGAGPEEVVRGFLTAGTGATDEYSAARQYLTPELSDTWHPDARVLVHRGEPTLVSRPEGDAGYRLSLDVASVVDDKGVLERKSAGTTADLDLGLTRVDGQWRISQAPDVTVLSENAFEEIFEPHYLYFADHDLSDVVVDPRWFAERTPVSTSIVRSLLDGPAPYLRDAVTTAFPAGTTLARSSVPVQDGTATVELSVPGFDPANIEINRRMHDQLSLSLGPLASVDDVELLVDGAPVELGTGWADTAPNREISVPSRQIGLRDGELVFYQAGRAEPVDGLPPLGAFHLAGPAMDAAAEHFAFVDTDTGSLVTVARDREPVVRFSGTGLTRPSFDEHGWVWAADSAGAVRTVRAASGDPERVEAPWLAGLPVSSLRISRGGTRALVVTHQEGASHIWLAGVVRDADGTPRRLNEPYRVAADVDADAAVWLSDRDFAAAPLHGTGPLRPRVYDVAGQYRELPALTGITGISGGNGTSSVYAVAGETLHLLTGSAWTPQSDEVRDTAFAG